MSLSHATNSWRRHSWHQCFCHFGGSVIAGLSMKILPAQGMHCLSYIDTTTMRHIQRHIATAHQKHLSNTATRVYVRL